MSTYLVRLELMAQTSSTICCLVAEAAAVMCLTKVWGAAGTRQPDWLPSYVLDFDATLAMTSRLARTVPAEDKTPGHTASHRLPITLSPPRCL